MTLNPTNPEPGIYFDVPEPIYRRAPGISQTALKACEMSMAHFRQVAFGSRPSEPTDAQIVGTLTHALVLQGRKLFVPRPKGMTFQTKEGKEWKKAQKLEPVSREIAADLYRMRRAVWSNPTARAILERDGNAEVAAFKVHEKTGLMLKGLADFLVTDDNLMTVIPDLKTTTEGGASEKEFSKTIYNYGYHRQAAFYLDLFGATHFVFIVVEKVAPYAVACYALDHDAIAVGRWENERDLARVAECVRTGVWPGYPDVLLKIGLPEWARKEF